jgi:hypothetical protein
VYIRHSSGVQITALSLSSTKRDFRTAIVLDDVHQSVLKKISVKEPERKKNIYTNNSTAVVLK